MSNSVPRDRDAPRAPKVFDIHFDRDEVRVGDKIPVWWSQEDGSNLATIVEIGPYKGRYPQYFKYNIKLTSKNGTVESVL